MGNLFNMDNKFFRFMGKIADLIILNLLCILCCLPIITIGASISSMYYVTMKMVRDEESYIIRGFFHSFRQNFKQSLVFNLIMLGAALLLYLDFSIVLTMDTLLSKGLLLFFVMMSFLYLLVYVFLYPLLAKFYNTIRGTFGNALRMAIRHLPFTFLMMLLTLCPLAVFLLPSYQSQSMVLMLFFLFGFAGIAYLKSMILVRIFDRYIPKEETEEADALEAATEEALPDHSIE